MSALTLALLVLAVIGVGILVLIRRLAGPATVSQCDPQWISNFSIARYRPMLRLLDDADYKYLSGQPGYSPKFINKLRAERRAIFRAYLRDLVGDFHKLHMAARMVLIHAAHDRSDLAMMLVRQRVVFTLAILAIECRLMLHVVGIGAVDVRNVVAAVENMRISVGDFAAAQQTAA